MKRQRTALAYIKYSLLHVQFMVDDVFLCECIFEKMTDMHTAITNYLLNGSLPPTK